MPQKFHTAGNMAVGATEPAVETGEPPPPVQAPILESPRVESLTDNGGIPLVDTDTLNGTLYLVIVPNLDAPSAVQVKTGKQSDGSPAIRAASQPVVLHGLQECEEIIGLDAHTDYTVVFMHSNSMFMDSIPVSAEFHTL
jgi:hypothetical protein